MSDLSLWCEEAEEDRDVGREEEEETEEATEEARGRTARGPQEVRASWDPAASGQRVIRRLLRVEERYVPSALYIALVQRDPERREELAKWALEVCCECGCDEAVFPLAVSLMDRFLSVTLSLPVAPFCLASACVLIASKLSEVDTVSADTLCAAAEYGFQASNLREMERVVLGTLRWDTASVTPQDFLPLLLAPVGARLDGGEPDRAGLLSTVRRHGDTLVAMCACDARFLGAPPSLVAAAALNSALRGLADGSPAHLASLGDLLAGLCQTDATVLRCYSEMIEDALRRRLRAGGEAPRQKDDEVEDERAGTPTDMREVDF